MGTAVAVTGASHTLGTSESTARFDYGGPWSRGRTVTVRVEVEPSLLAWARERSRADSADLAKRFPHLADWERGDRRPTLKQLEAFARATHTPIGLLLLLEPPEEPLPIPDFRTLADTQISRPSVDLLHTIYICQQRQDWYRHFALAHDQPPLDFVGSLDTSSNVVTAGDEIRESLGFGLDARTAFSTWTEALSGLAQYAEEVGVLVMINGVVGSDTHRKLDPQEFRGFALVDDRAPVVFINGADTKAAQIFTLAHELIHIWIGQSALDNAPPGQQADRAVERWCNEVAAEILVPKASLRQQFDDRADLRGEVRRLARVYKVSTLVALRAIYDAGYLNWGDFRRAYVEELESLPETQQGDGGNFYNTAPIRASKRFTRAIINDVLEGRTPYREAFRFLGFRKAETFDELARRMGVA